MKVVALTGGIGAGKSTVARMLAERGAVLVDADSIVRELQEPGQPVFEAMVERFGDGIVSPDGRLDRQVVADIVFRDPDALADLNAIVHPAVGAEMQRRVELQRGTDDVVVADIPLLTHATRKLLHVDTVLVVDAPVDVAVERLVRSRGFTEADARARVANQKSREERRAMADVVLDNSGDEAALAAQVDQVWAALRTRTVPPRP